MCCVCNLLCKLISFAISLLFLVAVVLLILWGVGVLWGSDSNDDDNNTNQRFLEGVTGAGMKHFAST